MKHIICKQLFSGYEVQQTAERPKLRGHFIKCHDCGKPGYFAMTSPSNYTLPKGWVMAWNGLTPLYNCPECGEKRRQFVLDLIAK